MSKNVKEQMKESFMNKQFIIILIATILFLILSLVTREEYAIYCFLVGLFLLFLFIIGFFSGVKMRNHSNGIRNGKLKYEPYSINKSDFIEECKNCLIYSFVRINEEIYEIETQPDKVNSTNYDKFVCYINDNEIIGIDNFINYKFDGKHSFNDLENIEFLECNNNDPKKYFVDKII